MRIQAVMALLLLGLATPTLVTCNIEGDIIHKQRTALSDPNNVLESWDPTLTNPCTWVHVLCNVNNTVIGLELGSAGVSGYLVPELGQLKNLEYLEFFENNISGVIPPSLGNLTNLVSLDLYNNSLTGRIPSTLGNLKSLKYLRLNGNNLTGVLPRTVLHLAVTGSLQELDVSNNSLDGALHNSSQVRVTSIIQDKSSRAAPSEQK